MVDRKGSFSSATLGPDAIALLQTAFKSGRWYQDRWSRRECLDAAHAVRDRSASGGLVLVGPGMHFEPPPPFPEHFEPIELGAADEQLRTLTGVTPTRQERQIRWILLIVGAALFALIAPFVAIAALGGAYRIVLIVVGVAGGCVGLVLGIVWLSKFGSSWYLVPGGVAVLKRLGKSPHRLQLRTRYDSLATFRYVSNGKTTMLVLELWRPGERKPLRRAVSDREAVGFLAAWQSPHPPPSIAQLRELESPA